jgi:phosphatidylserine/phosphatidylglycerophosphate/cardiolipin synthase-like enzyme
MIIDKEIVITGSFNFSKAAEESNAENLLVVRDKELASRYIENWKLHDEHSEPYQARVGRSGEPNPPKNRAKLQ